MQTVLTSLHPVVGALRAAGSRAVGPTARDGAAFGHESGAALAAEATQEGLTWKPHRICSPPNRSWKG